MEEDPAAGGGKGIRSPNPIELLMPPRVGPIPDFVVQSGLRTRVTQMHLCLSLSPWLNLVAGGIGVQMN